MTSTCCALSGCASAANASEIVASAETAEITRMVRRGSCNRTTSCDRRYYFDSMIIRRVAHLLTTRRTEAPTDLSSRRILEESACLSREQRPPVPAACTILHPTFCPSRRESGRGDGARAATRSTAILRRSRRGNLRPPFLDGSTSVVRATLSIWCPSRRRNHELPSALPPRCKMFMLILRKPYT